MASLRSLRYHRSNSTRPGAGTCGLRLGSAKTLATLRSSAAVYDASPAVSSSGVTIILRKRGAIAQRGEAQAEAEAHGDDCCRRLRIWRLATGQARCSWRCLRGTQALGFCWNEHSGSIIEGSLVHECRGEVSSSSRVLSCNLYDGAWRASATCRVAGCLCLCSSGPPLVLAPPERKRRDPLSTHRLSAKSTTEAQHRSINQ